ncbi:MAG: ATP-binding protein [Bacilli bacterium]|nr:ATP-binding protein [Bacilli bacterium]
MNKLNIINNGIMIMFFVYLFWMYKSKDNPNTPTGRIFNRLLISNGLVLISNFIWLFAGHFLRDYESIATIFYNIYLVFKTLWIYYLTYYTILSSYENNRLSMDIYETYKKKIEIISYIVLIIASIIQFLLPLEILYDDNDVLLKVTGLGVKYWYLFLVFGFIFCVSFSLFVLRNKKNSSNTVVIKKKKGMFGIIIVISSIFFFLKYIDTTLSLAIIATTMISYLLYFSKEDPDLKLINKLEFANEQASRANNAKVDFLASMSHEIRTPLNAIVGLSQLIKSSDSMEQIKEDSTEIMIESENLLEIVDSILDINMLEAGKIELIEMKYNMKDEFYDIFKKVSIRLDNKPIEFKTNITNDLPYLLYGDIEKIKRIITNLLTNAVKYTEQGTVDFTVDCHNIGDICNLVFTIKDTGRGMSQEQLDKLFTKFYRLDADRDSSIEGTGLGLSITKSLVELMDGEIKVDSKLGEGSTFIVTLSQKIKN